MLLIIHNQKQKQMLVFIIIICILGKLLFINTLGHKAH